MSGHSAAPAFRERFKAALAVRDEVERLDALKSLSEAAPGYVETIQLDKALSGIAADAVEKRLTRLRVAILSSDTINHLLPGLRVAALRRGFFFDVFAGAFAQYRQEVLEPASRLKSFAPEVIVLSLSARAQIGALPIDADREHVEQVLQSEVAEVRSLWEAARHRFGAVVLQQTYLDVFEPIFGSYDRVAPASPARVIDRLNQLLAEAARDSGVALVDAARACARDGIDAWFDAARWLQGKMEIAPQAAGRYGELVARVVAAHRGRSRKCVVFDLDNTLWGGVLGDVGIEGLVLGEGSATGEAHLELQRYARRLNERGVILAVCSKNDPALAEQAFSRHPEMVLKRSDIACFVANWKDKAENLRDIAQTLNIGLDSLVFVDDNPAERARVREAFPMIAVPELPEDPAHYVRALADAGFFEAVSFTREDSTRAASYAANAEREALRSAAQSMDEFLRGLDMEITYGPVGDLELERATQLINKTNQFNTTGRRYSAKEMAQLALDPDSITLQFRLMDRLGDSGLVSVMILHLEHDGVAELDVWVMSCRVFGRQLEDEAMNIAVEQIRARGIETLSARFVPTGRNAVIGDLFRNLGFQQVSGSAAKEENKKESQGEQRWQLSISKYQQRRNFIRRKSGLS
jgi:FkbH-like protein